MEAKIKEKMDNWYRYHCIFNHRDATVRALCQAGIITDALEPLVMTCTSCDAANERRVPFSNQGSQSRPISDIPWSVIEFDLWGPVKVKGYNEYIFAVIDRGTSESFIQTLTRKKDVIKALRAFFLWFNSTKRQVEIAMKLPVGTVKVRDAHYDRGGEQDHGGKVASAVVALLISQGVRPQPNSTDCAESGTTKVERLWPELYHPAVAAIYESGTKRTFLTEYMHMIHTVLQVSPTEGNRIGGGAAPAETCGRTYDLASLVPPGAPAFMLSDHTKGEPGVLLGIVVGYVKDGGGGYIVETENGRVASVQCRVRVDLTTTRSLLDAQRKDPMTATEFVRRCYDIDRNTTFQDLAPTSNCGFNDDDSEPYAAPIAHPIGTASGSGGSRLMLDLPYVPPISGSSADPSSAVDDADGRGTPEGNGHDDGNGEDPGHKALTPEEAKVLWTEAQKVNRLCIWNAHNNDGSLRKTGKSGTRLAFQVKLRTARDLAAARKLMIMHTDSKATAAVTSGDPVDCMTRNPPILRFGDAVPVPTVTADAAPQCRQRNRRHLRGTTRAAHVSAIGPLNGEEQTILGEAVQWCASANSERTAKHWVGAYPDNVTTFALRTTIAAATPPGFTGTKKIRRPTLSVYEAADHPQYQTVFRPAIVKELGGIIANKVYKVVPRSEVPTWAKVATTRTIVETKSNGTGKARCVVQGHLETKGEHYLHSSSPMAMMESMFIVCAICNHLGMEATTFDFSQAFLSSPIGLPHQYIELPDMPEDLLVTHGPARSATHVGLLLKELYGRHNAGRAFARTVLLYLEVIMREGDMEVRIFNADRCIFSIKWQSHFLIVILHVDDGLEWHTDECIVIEFIRRLRRRFIVTQEPATQYCGFEINHDPQQRTLKFSQHKHLDRMIDYYAARDMKPRPQPMPTGDAGARARIIWNAPVTDRDKLNYAVFIGDAVWMANTRKDISEAVHSLAQHIRNPGPAQVEAALHLLRYLIATRDDCLTFQGTDEALQTGGWDQRNKLIIEFDASLPTPGTRATSGVNAFLNGACVLSLCRLQKSVSRFSCEAETKAAMLAAECCRGLQDLIAEVLECDPGATCLRGDCRGSQRQIEKKTDRQTQAAYKRAISYVEYTVNAGYAYLDLIPREHNTGDNTAQQGSPISEWLRRRNHVMGITPHVHLTGTIRDIIRTDITKRTRATAMQLIQNNSWWNDPD